MIKKTLPYNSSLLMLLGSTLLIGETKKLSCAIVMTITCSIVMVLSCIIISLIKDKLDKHVKVLTYVVVVSGLCGLFEIIIETFLFDIYNELHHYLPVIAASLLVFDVVDQASVNDLKTSIKNATLVGTKLIIIGIICGLLRELLAYGSIMGIQLSFLNNYHIDIFKSATGGFLMAGFVASLMCNNNEPLDDYFVNLVFNSRKEEE